MKHLQTAVSIWQQWVFDHACYNKDLTNNTYKTFSIRQQRSPILKLLGGPQFGDQFMESKNQRKPSFVKLGRTVKLREGTLPKTNIAIENPPVWWYLQGNMGIFMGKLLVSGRVSRLKWSLVTSSQWKSSKDWSESMGLGCIPNRTPGNKWRNEVQTSEFSWI